MDQHLVVCYLRPARRKAREVATAEALCLLRDLDPVAPAGGPLSERGGVFWIGLPADALETALARFPRLGYTQAVDLLEPAGTPAEGRHSGRVATADPSTHFTHWRRKTYRLVRVYQEDPAALRERAPDRRTFLFEGGAGEVRAVTGYRGDGSPLGRRGLPVPDARLLVNLVSKPGGGRFLDPFAGVGGIAIEALAGGWQVVSADLDPALRHGLARLGSRHCVADARHLPLATASVDAIATEPPYHRQTADVIVGALREMGRALVIGGRLAILCAAWQTDGLRREGASLGLEPFLDSPINRKGLDVAVLAWHKGAGRGM